MGKNFLNPKRRDELATWGPDSQNDKGFIWAGRDLSQAVYGLGPYIETPVSTLDWSTIQCPKHFTLKIFSNKVLSIDYCATNIHRRHSSPLIDSSGQLKPNLTDMELGFIEDVLNEYVDEKNTNNLIVKIDRRYIELLMFCFLMLPPIMRISLLTFS